MADLSRKPDFGTLPVAATPTGYVSPASAAARRVGNVFQAIVSVGAELSMRQANVLARAVETPGQCTVRGLAEVMVVSKPAVTRALDRLEELGMAQRRMDPKDRRSVLIDPTADGRAWVAAVAKTLGGA